VSEIHLKINCGSAFKKYSIKLYLKERSWESNRLYGYENGPVTLKRLNWRQDEMHCMCPCYASSSQCGRKKPGFQSSRMILSLQLCVAAYFHPNPVIYLINKVWLIDIILLTELRPVSWHRISHWLVSGHTLLIRWIRQSPTQFLLTWFCYSNRSDIPVESSEVSDCTWITMQ